MVTVSVTHPLGFLWVVGYNVAVYFLHLLGELGVSGFQFLGVRRVVSYKVTLKTRTTENLIAYKQQSTNRTVVKLISVHKFYGKVLNVTLTCTVVSGSMQ